MNSRMSRRTLLRTGATAAATGAAGAGAVWATDPAAYAGTGRTSTHERGAGDLGARLYERVLGYSRASIHRTGTAGEAASLAWLERELRGLGVRPGRWTYSYPHYEWSATVRVGRRAVQTVPLYYEGVGGVRTTTPFVRSVTTSAAGSDPAVLQAISDAQADGAELAVLLTTNQVSGYAPYTGLVAYNADPDTAKSGLPTLFIPGNLADAVAAYGVSVDFQAGTRPGHAYDVTGWLGTRTPVSDPIVITTPLSGWFTCAAERATGIALALEVASEVAREHPVFFLGNTGHELNNYGARAYLADEFDLDPVAVFHFGASLAAGGTKTAPGSTFDLVPRVGASNPAPDDVPGLVDDLAAGNFTPTTVFPGEGAEWSKTLGPSVPLLSIAGQFPQFHTPDDRPQITTSPDLLVKAYRSLRASVQDLLDAI